LKTDLIEEYANEKEPDDGEFYCKIREYQGFHGEKNSYFERRWWARLSAMSLNRKDRLDQLFRHGKFAQAFDALLAIRALFGGMRLSVVHKMIAMKCDEVSRILS
jgi:hypothetical protein